MAGTKKNSAGQQQPIDEKSRYAKMSASEMSKELAQEVDFKQVTLPKQEYAELCSAIRTRYANAIPSNSSILLGNSYYMFRYDSWAEKIVCIYKAPITTDKDFIEKIMEL